MVLKLQGDQNHLEGSLRPRLLDPPPPDLLIVGRAVGGGEGRLRNCMSNNFSGGADATGLGWADKHWAETCLSN